MNARARLMLGILFLALPGASRAVTLDLESPEPGTYTVRGSFDAAATTSAVWSVLTDYDGLSRFVPDLKLSRVRERTADGVLLEQVATGRFLVFHKHVRVLLRCVETPGEKLAFEDSLGADFKLYRGAWTLIPEKGGVHVHYELRATPKGAAPGAIARRAMARGARDLLERVRQEILRRT
ncbi:MAG: SRPBCC family protein [Elusimicrobia bacterium]|nr:SRPBCC family protein [Elusimicrobiota bacterium]